MATGNVIYLPPGVAAPAPTQLQQPAMPTGIPFDRNFFQNILPQAVGAFCAQTECTIPRVELLTVDGVTHYVSGIIGVHDTWVALQIAKEEHRHAIQVFIPYTSIFRVEVHPESERRRHMGFITEPNTPGKQLVITEPAEIAEPASTPVVEIPAVEAPSAQAAPIDAPEIPPKPARRSSTRKKPVS